MSNDGNLQLFQSVTLDLDVLCYQCKGDGVVRDGRGNVVDCPECFGVGWRVTKSGRKFLRFMERHLDGWMRRADELKGED
jgi:hypothetical protein